MVEPRITDLLRLIGGLAPAERALAERLFAVSEATGRLCAPLSMRPWLESSFGSVEAVEKQRVVRVTNRVTLEGTLFNSLRASRPLDTHVEADPEGEISATRDDPFCHPEEGTPKDVFGRVRGEHCVTASNVAKYDAYHAVIVFDEHDPLALTPKKVADYLSVAAEWHRRVLEVSPESRYPFVLWNCLWRAGGSIVHGHAQVAATSGSHYPKVERLRRDALAYKEKHGSDYFRDLARVHRALGLDVPASGGVSGFANLTPLKEKEIFLVGKGLDDDGLKTTLGNLLQGYVRNLGVRSFNVAFYLPPSGGTEEDWSGFPAVVRLVDRGDLTNRTSDIGAMELYAAPVVTSDPFEVARRFRSAG